MLITTQVAGSAASFAASSFMTTAIVKSDGGLTRPYSRILLGLSVSDMVQSICLMFGPLLVPKTTPLGHWAIGNRLTCTVSGTPIIISMISIPLYYFAMCLYTICKVKRNMTDAVFAKTVEKYMHYFIFLFSVIPAIISIATKSTNSTVLGSFCSYAAYPTGCRQAPHIFGECDQSAGVVSVLIAIYAGAVPVACFFGIVIIMAIICWHVITRDRIFGSPSSGSTTSILSIRRTQGSDGLRNNGGSMSSLFPVSLESGSRLKSSDLPNSQLTSQNESFKYESGHESVVPNGEVADRILEQGTLPLKSSANPTSLTFQDESSKKFASGPTASTQNEHRFRRPLPDNQCSVGTRESLRSGIQDPRHQQETDTIRRTIRREIFLQAFWFVAAFFCTFIFFHILQLKLVFGYTPSDIHYQVASFLFPVGGVFNVLVYTRPKVSNLRIRQPQLSRLKAFWMVVKAGGVIPNIEPNEIPRPWNQQRNIIDSINHQAKPGVYAKQPIDNLSMEPMHLVSSESSRSANNSLIRPHTNGRDTNLNIDSAGASLEVLQEVQSSDEERVGDCEQGKESVQSSDDVMGPISYSQITSNSHALSGFEDGSIMDPISYSQITSNSHELSGFEDGSIMDPISYSQVTSNSNALSGFEDGSIMDPISYSQITSNSHALSRDEYSSIEGHDAEDEDIVQNAYARAMERIDQLKTK